MNAIQALYQMSYIPMIARREAARMFLTVGIDYSGLIAETGQPSSHAPQSMQTSESITY